LDYVDDDAFRTAHAHLHKMHPLDPQDQLMDEVDRWPVEGVVEIAAADADHHLVDQVDAGRWNELSESGDSGRHLGAALGDVHRLDVEPGLQLHHSGPVSGQRSGGMVGA
jgi:hypothetical protein